MIIDKEGVIAYHAPEKHFYLKFYYLDDDGDLQKINKYFAHKNSRDKAAAEKAAFDKLAKLNKQFKNAILANAQLDSEEIKVVGVCPRMTVKMTATGSISMFCYYGVTWQVNSGHYRTQAHHPVPFTAGNKNEREKAYKEAVRLRKKMHALHNE